jgi:hypothetical protein
VEILDTLASRLARLVSTGEQESKPDPESERKRRWLFLLAIPVLIVLATQLCSCLGTVGLLRRQVPASGESLLRADYSPWDGGSIPGVQLDLAGLATAAAAGEGIWGPGGAPATPTSMATPTIAGGDSLPAPPAEGEGDAPSGVPQEGEGAPGDIDATIEAAVSATMQSIVQTSDAMTATAASAAQATSTSVISVTNTPTPTCTPTPTPTYTSTPSPTSTPKPNPTNTDVPPSTTSGYTVSNVTYTLDPADATLIDMVTFDISPTGGAGNPTTVRIELESGSGTWFTCAETVAPEFECSIGGSVSVIDADQLRVVAVQ